MNGYKAAFDGSMKAYKTLALNAVRWLKHVTGIGGDSVAHYWANDCETCKEIAAFVADWEKAQP